MSTQTIFKTVGQTSQACDVSLVQNAASTAAGDPVLGLAFNTSLLVCYYRIPPTGTLTSISLATQTVGGAYSSGGFVQISSTNAPGQYRFDIPNACLASAGECNVTFSGIPAGTAGNMETHTLKIIVMTVDLFASGSIFAQAQQTQLTEGYAALNAAPTASQALMLATQFIQNRAIVGTTETVYQVNGSSTAITTTLNSSSNPTSRARAT